MSSLEKARAFAKRSTLSAAMSILPFALAAMNADAAAVTLSPDLYTPPSVTLSGLTSSAYEFFLMSTTVGDVDGQKLVGGGTFAVPFVPIPLSTPTLYIDASGPAAGTFSGDTVGVHWDFTLNEFLVVPCDGFCSNTNSVSANLFDWTINYSIDHDGGTASRIVTGGGASGNFSGSSSISGLTGINPNTWSIVLSVNYNGSNGFTIDIPANSVAIPGALQAVPEPATMALMGAGLAILAFRRIRRA